jgi:hypothetical protein
MSHITNVRTHTLAGLDKSLAGVYPFHMPATAIAELLQSFVAELATARAENRPMECEYLQGAIDRAQVACFVKQLGARPLGVPPCAAHRSSA